MVAEKGVSVSMCFSGISTFGRPNLLLKIEGPGRDQDESLTNKHQNTFHISDIDAG